MLKHLSSGLTTKLEISGVAFPAGSDRGIFVSVQPIPRAGDFQRSVNGDLVNIARQAFQKYSVDISCNDMRPLPVFDLFPGRYLEVLAPEPHAISLPQAQLTALIPAGSVGVVGLTDGGDLVQPVAQPADMRPLALALDPARVAALRSPVNVSFPEPVRVIRFRRILPCLLVNWSASGQEIKSQASWDLQLEEV